ncbi:hypothetical protein [Burkholderia metallica]
MYDANPIMPFASIGAILVLVSGTASGRGWRTAHIQGPFTHVTGVRTRAATAYGGGRRQALSNCLEIMGSSASGGQTMAVMRGLIAYP